MRLIVSGHSRHGKDFICEHLAREHQLKFKSSSRVAMGVVYRSSPELQEKYSSAEEAWRYRNINHDQPIWFEAICAYNSPDPTRLARKVFLESEIYCGMRDLRELNACIRAGICDLAIWVDGSQRKPPQPSSSCTVTADDADVILPNNRDKAAALKKIDRLIRFRKAQDASIHRAG